jgi:hypothetical protein
VLEGGVSVLKGVMRPRDTGGRRRPPERKDLPERAALLSFGSAIKSGSLPSNPDELVAIGVTKISVVPRVGLFGVTHQKADCADVRGRCRLAIDGFGDHETAAIVRVARRPLVFSMPG